MAVAAVVLALAGCGDDEAPLTWATEPAVRQSPSLPDDRLVTAAVRNETDDELELRAKDISVLDASGRELRSSAAFLTGFVYSHVPYNRGRDEAPGALPRREQERLGRVVTIPRGGTAPLTVSWRGGHAARIEYGSGTLQLP